MSIWIHDPRGLRNSRMRKNDVVPYPNLVRLLFSEVRRDNGGTPSENQSHQDDSEDVSK